MPTPRTPAHKEPELVEAQDSRALRTARPPRQPVLDQLVIDGEVVPLAELARVWRAYRRLDNAEMDFVARAVKRHRRELELQPYQAELIQMQNHLIAHKQRMIILFEGRDAAGKGGTIRAVTRHMNERHYRVVALGKPSTREESQWYYQKYVTQFPAGGEIVLFDRSWYTRALVERVFGWCTEKEYKDFMRGVTGFEKDLIRQGTILVKLYFSVTQEMQEHRFERRLTDPLRQWKLSQVDMQAQDRWDEFTEVKYDMLRRSHTPASAWHIIRSDDKHQARLNTMKLILNAVPYQRRNPDLDFVPDPEVVISGARELETLEAERLRKGHELHSVIL